ncbi:MAG: hypothetical protein BWY92_01462 [Firmicutes bacterium ADurb.BinA052]|nr:MAG: hypothetical protein BWY92_01462 [Firmicutes bacterium ADurb.BinA052]
MAISPKPHTITGVSASARNFSCFSSIFLITCSLLNLPISAPFTNTNIRHANPRSW